MFMPKRFGVLLASFFVIFYGSSLLSVEINEINMRKASRYLTEKESDLVKAYLNSRINELKQDPLRDSPIKQAEEAKLQEIFQEFYRSNYDSVLQEISALGDNPQALLQTSKLRTVMLSGGLEQTPWFLREIAGLDWFFERDSKRTRKKWPRPQDKLVYIMTLADDLVMNHNKVFDATLVRDAVDTLEKHINYLLERAPKTFKSRVIDILLKLQKLREGYVKE